MKRDSTRSRHNNPWLRLWAAVRVVFRATSGAAAIAFALGIAVDIAVSPSLLALLDEIPARWAPTGLAWLWLTPVLLAQGLVAALRPDRTPASILGALTSPPPGTAAAAWVGIVMLALTGALVGAVILHWSLAGAALALLLLTLRFILHPAAALGGAAHPVRDALHAGAGALWDVAWMGALVLAVAFIVGNIALSIALLPFAKQAGGPVSVGSGFMVVVQANLFLALAVPGMAAALATAWQAERRRPWRNSR